MSFHVLPCFCPGTDTASMSHVLLLHDANNCAKLDVLGVSQVHFQNKRAEWWQGVLLLFCTLFLLMIHAYIPMVNYKQLHAFLQLGRYKLPVEIDRTEHWYWTKAECRSQTQLLHTHAGYPSQTGCWSNLNSYILGRRLLIKAIIPISSVFWNYQNFCHNTHLCILLLIWALKLWSAKMYTIFFQLKASLIVVLMGIGHLFFFL